MQTDAPKIGDRVVCEWGNVIRSSQSRAIRGTVTGETTNFYEVKTPDASAVDGFRWIKVSKSKVRKA